MKERKMFFDLEESDFEMLARKNKKLKKFLEKSFAFAIFIYTLPLRVFIFLTAQVIFFFAKIKPIRINFKPRYDNCHFTNKHIPDHKDANTLTFGLHYMMKTEKEMKDVFKYVKADFKNIWGCWIFIVAHEIAHYIQHERHFKWYVKAHSKSRVSLFGCSPKRYRELPIEANADKIALVICKGLGVIKEIKTQEPERQLTLKERLNSAYGEVFEGGRKSMYPVSVEFIGDAIDKSEISDILTITTNNDFIEPSRMTMTKEKTWFEVHIDLGKETRTLKTCDILAEARRVKKEIMKGKVFYIEGSIVDVTNPKRLHIDEWKNPDNPEIIRTIE